MADYANVKFLRGTQSALDTLIAGSGNRFTKGAFYLTSDTDRLYFAQTEAKLVPLNQFIRNVANLTELETYSATAADGDYFYVKDGNIFAIYEAGQGFTQLNPDTNNRINTTTSGIYAGTNSGNATINLNISDDASVNPRTATGTVSIHGGNNVTVSQSGNTITIDAANDENTTYTIKSANASLSGTGVSGAKVQLDASGSGTDSEITLKSANSNLTVSQDSNVVTLTAADQSVQNVDAAFNAQGNFQVSVQDKTGAAVASTAIAPTISYGDTSGNNTASTAKFLSGTASLDVYTKAQTDAKIDARLAGLDAMTYMGTVSSSDASTKLVTNANWGLVYKASNTISTPVSAKTGDLIISQKANGYTGNEGGTNSTEWQVIVQQDDQAITFDSNASTGLTAVSDQRNGVGRIIAAGSKMKVSHNIPQGSNIMTTTIAQDDSYTAQSLTGSNANVTQTAKNSATFTALTSLTTDAYGNVTGAGTKTLSVVDTHANVNAVDAGVANISGGGGATVTMSVSDSDGVSKSGTFNVKSNSLTVAKGTGAADLSVELSWGSF